jgi:glycerol-3-phosphate cytidylyltransferase
MAKLIGYAPGVYDMFHVGHLNILRQAAARCDHLIAGVVSDEMAVLAKGKRPVVPLKERLEIVASIDCVDAVWAETLPDKLDTWREVGFHILFKGDDWRGTAKGRRFEAAFAAVGVEIVYFPYTLHTSSTLLRAALEAMQGDRAPHSGTPPPNPPLGIEPPVQVAR